MAKVGVVVAHYHRAGITFECPEFVETDITTPYSAIFFVFQVRRHGSRRRSVVWCHVVVFCGLLFLAFVLCGVVVVVVVVSVVVGRLRFLCEYFIFGSFFVGFCRAFFL
jgi:hypothetical protein